MRDRRPSPMRGAVWPSSIAGLRIAPSWHSDAGSGDRLSYQVIGNNLGASRREGHRKEHDRIVLLKRREYEMYQGGHKTRKLMYEFVRRLLPSRVISAAVFVPYSLLT
jgi:hypothetical protein